MLLRKTGGQLLIVPERMKWVRQSINDSQLWTCLVVKVKSDAAKTTTAKEPGMLGPRIKVNWTWVKQEIARMSIDILGISELKWIGMGEFNSDDHYTYYCGQETLRRSGAVLINNKRVQNVVPGCSLKNDRMISVHFQGKPFNSTVI